MNTDELVEAVRTTLDAGLYHDLSKNMTANEYKIRMTQVSKGIVYAVLNTIIQELKEDHENLHDDFVIGKKKDDKN